MLKTFQQHEATIITHLTAVQAKLEHIGLHIEFPHANEATITAQQQTTAAATSIITTQLDALEFQITTSTLGLTSKIEALEQSLFPPYNSEVYSDESVEGVDTTYLPTDGSLGRPHYLGSSYR